MKKCECLSLLNKVGFTLIEVMVAMSILAIGIMAVLGLQYRIVNGNTSANVVTQELSLAQRYMEEAKNIGDLAALASRQLSNVDMMGRIGGPYNVTITVTNPLGGTISRFIRVTVNKTGGGGHPVILSSLTHGNGL